jgi:leader peptidase (prepilin peptidase)/N-methyltransferase
MSTVVFVGFAALFGLAIGSFLNVVIDRLPAGRPIVKGRSQCDSCGHTLGPWDLVPVASYLALRGRCRYCGTAIPRRIPLVEAANGLLYAFAVGLYGATPLGLITVAYLSILIVVFVIDLERRLILNVVTLPGIALALAAAPWGPVGGGSLSLRDAYLDAAYGAVLGGAVLLLIYLGALFIMRREALGLGDVKLGALLGVMLGFVPTVVTLDIAFVGGGLLALGLWVFRVRRPGEYIPFGPFLVGAAVISLFWGQALFDWYWALFG